MASNVFISYSDKDRRRIIPILGLLKNIQDLKIFFADRSINPGEEISKTIANAIKDSNLFLVFFSISAMQSSFVQQEIGFAKANNKIIIPILLDGTKPNALLSGLNYVDLSNQSKIQSELNRLYCYITSNAKRQQQKELIAILALLILGCFIFLRKK